MWKVGDDRTLTWITSASTYYSFDQVLGIVLALIGVYVVVFYSNSSLLFLNKCIGLVACKVARTFVLGVKQNLRLLLCNLQSLQLLWKLLLILWWLSMSTDLGILLIKKYGLGWIVRLTCMGNISTASLSCLHSTKSPERVIRRN